MEGAKPNVNGKHRSPIDAFQTRNYYVRRLGRDNICSGATCAIERATRPRA